MWLMINDAIRASSVWCEKLTDKERHNKNCIYVVTIKEYDLYVLGEKYYYCPEND